MELGLFENFFLSVLPMKLSTAKASTAKASTFSGAFRHGWRRSGRSWWRRAEQWALSKCECRWQSCALQFAVFVGLGESIFPSPMTPEQPSPYFPGLSSVCSHFLVVILSFLLSMPGLQTFWSSLLLIFAQSSAWTEFSDLSLRQRPISITYSILFSSPLTLSSFLNSFFYFNEEIEFFYIWEIL